MRSHGPASSGRGRSSLMMRQGREPLIAASVRGRTSNSESDSSDYKLDASDSDAAPLDLLVDGDGDSADALGSSSSSRALQSSRSHSRSILPATARAAAEASVAEQSSPRSHHAAAAAAGPPVLPPGLLIFRRVFSNLAASTGAEWQPGFAVPDLQLLTLRTVAERPLLLVHNPPTVDAKGNGQLALLFDSSSPRARSPSAVGVSICLAKD